jgi:hypothetical protein
MRGRAWRRRCNGLQQHAEGITGQPVLIAEQWPSNGRMPDGLHGALTNVYAAEKCPQRQSDTRAKS